MTLRGRSVSFPYEQSDPADRRRHAQILPLRGSDQVLIGISSASLAPWCWLSEVLHRRIVAINGVPPTTEMVDSLPATDALWLALHLYLVTFEDCPLVVGCQQPDCGLAIEVRIDPAKIPLGGDAQRLHTAVGKDDDRVTYRRPALKDMSSLAARDSADADGVAMLTERCIQHLDRSGVSEAGTGSTISDADVAALDEALEVADPMVPETLDTSCPRCGATTSFPFDPLGVLVEAVRRDTDELSTSVHLLSSHYHWPLHEILDLTRSERRQWVGVLCEQLDPIVPLEDLAADTRPAWELTHDLTEPPPETMAWRTI